MSTNNPCFAFTSDFCSERFGVPIAQKYGRSGKDIKYIVLHKIGMSMQDFARDVQLPMSLSERLPDKPASLHYLVNESGAVHHYIKESDSAWGLSQISSPSVDVFGEISQTIDRICLHIGFEELTPIAEKTLAKVVCCTLQKYSLTLDSVIAAYNINELQDNIDHVNYSLIQRIKACLDGTEYVPPTSTPVQVTTPCCKELGNRLDVVDLKIEALVSELDAQIAKNNSLTSEVNTFLGLIAQQQANSQAFNKQVAELTRRLTALEICANCIDECSSKNCQKIHYRSTSVNANQFITPNQPVRINFNTKVSDNIPPSVTVGPLWNALLSCDCNTQITVNLRIKGASYCPNKIIWVDMVSDCGGKIRLGQVAPTTTAPLTLTGSAFLLSPKDCNLYFEIGTNDLEPKILEFSEVLIQCG